MINLRLILMIVTLPLLFGSCASVLNSKRQKVTIVTSSPKSKVYVDNVLQGEGTRVVSKMTRDRLVKQVKITKDGFKPIYKVHYQTSKSFLHIFSWIPFGVFIYTPFIDVGPKSFNYKKELVIDEKPLAITKRSENEKYVYLKNTAFDVKKEDLKFKKTKRRNLGKSNTKSKEIAKSEEDIKFDNSIFSDEVQEILKNNNYIDTTNTVFKSKTNTLYISSKISKIEFDNVYAYHANKYMSCLITKADIEWEIFDLYDQSKYKKLLKGKSGEFSLDSNDAAKLSIEDAIQQSFYNFMNSAEVKKLVKKENEEKVIYDLITLKQEGVINNIEDALSCTVTIKRKNSHGSGCIVSNDGYIVTNFHVVSGDEKINVVDNEGKEYEAKLIRKNENLDLALLKVEGNFKKAYSLKSEEKNYTIGDDIFVIGTPASLQLNQTVTKGIISGTRKHDNNVFIQIDASVNPGNSGGALVKKNGEFIGVINSKILGVGLEGLGFSIPIQKVREGLSIN